MSSNLIEVLVPIPLLEKFSYLLPKDLHSNPPKPGSRVIVPFGKRTLVGVVWKIDTEKVNKERKYKYIKEILDLEPLLDKESLDKAENFLKNKSPRLITVSRLDKRKNHEKIIMTLRNLKQIYPNIIYTCVGDGDEEENLKQLVKELGLDQQVLFLKKISQDLKNTLVAKSNIFVMPSIIYKKSVEGFGIAFIEAAQYGVPSIGGKDGGASDAIKHQKNGLICDGNNLDEIYSSINDILNNKKYLEYGKTAKENSNKFSWDIIIEKYKKILN